MKTTLVSLAILLVGLSTCFSEPIITLQPISQTVDKGGSATLSVRVTGTGSLSYQWRFRGLDLAGQTRSTLALRNVQVDDAGVYTVVVSDSDGAVTSEEAALAIALLIDPPFDPGLSIAHHEGELTVGWQGEGILERSGSLSGTWRRVGRNENPFRTALTGGARFFRVRNPHARSVPVVVPSSYDGERRLPLIVVLHGYSSNPGYIGGYMRVQALAESRGFLYAQPGGTKRQNGEQHFWNATDACCNPDASEVDDVAFLHSLISELIETLRADPRRVYLMGHSNGGFMSYRMACEHSAMIAGIASLAGATFLDARTCRPLQPVNILQIHGSADPVISYGGGQLFSAPYPGAMQTVQSWANYNRCRSPRTEPSASMDLDLNVPGLDTRATCYERYPPGGAVELWTIHGGGHSPALSSEFTERVVDWLLAHPKP